MTAGGMRSLIRLVEGASRDDVPEGLLRAVKAWATATVSDRGKTTAALLAHADEAKRFLARSYGTLYRGQAISPAEYRTLRKTGSATLTMPVLTSWTTSGLVADTYARDSQFEKGGASVMLVMPGRDLSPVIDLGRFVRMFTPDEILAADGREEYWLRDMVREHEVVVWLPDRLAVRRQNVVVIHDDDGGVDGE